MSLRTFISNIVNLARTDVVTTLTSGNSSGVSANTMASRLKVPDAARPLENSVTAFACITARREAIASAPLMLTDANDNAIESGRLFDLLDQPNPEMNWPQYVRVLETYNSLYNVMAYLPISEEGKFPTELVPLHPMGLRADLGVHQPSGTPRVWRWHYSDPTTGEQRDFTPDQIVIQRGFNPHAPLAALSPLTVLDRTIKGDICAREQNLGLFLNNATPRGYLSTEQKSSPEKMTEMLHVWNDANRGYLNSHKTAAFDSGMKYTAVQLSPAELEFLESLKAMRIDYYMAFRVYPAMLAEMTGETGLSQGSSTDSQRVAWWEDVGIPELGIIAAMHQVLVDRYGSGELPARSVRSLARTERIARARQKKPAAANVFVWFNDASIPALSRARMARTDTALKLIGVGYQPDEVSDYLDLGMSPHPDNMGRVSFSLQPIGEDAPAPEPAAPVVPPSATDQGVDGQPATDTTARSEVLDHFDRLETLIRSGVERKTSSVRNAFAAFIAPREKAAAKKWSRFFVEQRDRVLKRMAVLIANDTAARADGDGPYSVFPKAEEDMHLVARLQPLWAEHMKDGTDFLAQRVGIQNPMAIDDPRIMKAVEQRKIQGLKVNATTEEDLRSIIRKGIEDGASLVETSDNIAEYYRKACVGPESYRPATAARTQTAGIVNDGQMLAAREVGGLKKFWIHGDPKEPRESHIRAAAQYDEAHAIAIDSTFEVDGDSMDAPGDASADISNTANCTCMAGFTKSNETA